MVEARPGRWRALSILTLSRTGMALQFQSIAAMSSALIGAEGISFAFYGWLLGIYLFPGILISIPGGWLGTNFGERRVVIAGLLLMVAGGIWLALAAAPFAMLAARCLAGIGGIALNVLVTKMVADWFEGTDNVVPMGVLVSSWPIGLALAMIGLTPLVGILPLGALHVIAVLPAAIGVVLLWFWYPVGPEIAAQTDDVTSRLAPSELAQSFNAGAIWALFNTAIIVVLGFGPDSFIAAGSTAVEANSAYSLMSWVVAGLTIPGAMLAAKVQRRGGILVAGLILSAAMIALLAPFGPGVASLVVLVGLGIVGPLAPLIMGLPAASVPPQRRAMAYGVYFTVYYIAMALFPPVVGALRDISGSPDLPLYSAAVLMLGSAGFYAIYSRWRV